MLKLATAVLVTAFSAQVMAAGYEVEFTFTGELGENRITSLRVDATTAGNGGGSFLAAHGAMVTATGIWIPATGTCFFDNNGGLFCNFQVDGLSATMETNASFTGSITLKDSVGAIVDVAPVSLSDIAPL